MSLLTKKLKRAQSAWRDIEPAEAPTGQAGLEDGKYQVKISGAELKEDKKGGVGILFTFEVIRGKAEGRTQTKWAGVLDAEGDLLDAERIKWVKRDLASLLGEPIEDLEDLEDVLGDLLDKKTEIVVKTKNDYVNVYINGKATEVEEDEEDSDEDEEDEKPAKKKTNTSADDDDDDDEDEAEEDDEDEEEEAPKNKKSKKKSDDDDDEEETEEDSSDDDDDDDEDEEEKPAPKKGKGKSSEEDAEEEVERLLNAGRKKPAAKKRK